MEFTKEVKQEFINLLNEHNIVIVSNRYGKSMASVEHKVIGMRNGLRWDFTPLLQSLTDCKKNDHGFSNMTVRGYVREILQKSLRNLREEGFFVHQNVIDSVGDFVGQFWM